MKKNIEWNQGLAWSKKFETGYEEIDNQHRSLFKLVSDLVESCQKSNNNVAIGETLKFLVEYTVKHFEDEERIARIYKYPQCEQHKTMHDEFRETVGVFVRHYTADGDSGALFSAVNKVIVKWLINHIQGEDIKIARRIKLLAQNI